MQICEKNQHGEIVFDEKYCPACYRIDELEGIIIALEGTVQDLTSEIQFLAKEGA